MSDPKPQRRANGTFGPGTSGNRKGRPRKDRRITPPETIRDQFSDVSQFGISANLNGKRQKMTLLQSNMLTLALAGAAGDKTSARHFIGFAIHMTEQELGEMARMTKHLNGITPAYTTEENPARRQILRDAWLRAVAEATGEREATTHGLGRKPPRRR